MGVRKILSSKSESEGHSQSLPVMYLYSAQSHCVLYTLVDCERKSFTTQCYVTSVYAFVMCLIVSITDSINTAKPRIMQTRHTIAYDLSFLVQKISLKFEQGHLNWGQQMQVG